MRQAATLLYVGEKIMVQRDGDSDQLDNVDTWTLEDAVNGCPLHVNPAGQYRHSESTRLKDGFDQVADIDVARFFHYHLMRHNSIKKAWKTLARTPGFHALSSNKSFHAVKHGEEETYS